MIIEFVSILTFIQETNLFHFSNLAEGIWEVICLKKGNTVVHCKWLVKWMVDFFGDCATASLELSWTESVQLKEFVVVTDNVAVL